MQTTSSPTTLRKRIAAWLSHPQARWFALAAVLFAQTAMFLKFLPRPVEVLADNIGYEIPAQYLARGEGIRMPYQGLVPDDVVRGWVCTRHPGECHADGTYPTAVYPPGYTVFVAGVYTVTGVSPRAVVMLQLVMLLGMFVLFERLAHRYLEPRAYWAAMVMAFAYPFLARQATYVMSDMLHAFLYLASLSALMLMRPGALRGAAFGFTLATATLTRPYCMLVVPALFLIPSVLRTFKVTRREWLVAALCCALPFVAWTARNAYMFGKLVPFSTTGVGVGLMQDQLEWEIGEPYAKGNDVAYHNRFAAEMDEPYRTQFLEGKLPLWHTLKPVSDKLGAVGTSWIKNNPGKFTALCVLHMPKLWVSLGAESGGVSKTTYLMGVATGLLLLLGLWGAWRMRRDPRFYPLFLAVGLYWLFLVPFQAEARRTLPLRLPLILLAGVAVSRVLEPRTATVPSDPMPEGAT